MLSVEIGTPTVAEISHCRPAFPSVGRGRERWTKKSDISPIRRAVCPSPKQVAYFHTNLNSNVSIIRRTSKPKYKAIKTCLIGQISVQRKPGLLWEPCPYLKADLLWLDREKHCLARDLRCIWCLQRSAKRLVRGWEKFVLALAYLCSAWPCLGPV